jgi:uncharacterized repeat protein (TIGR02543 family)
MARKSTAFAAAAAVVGFSSAVLWAAPASAAVPACGLSGSLVSGNICEQTFTAPGAATFTPNAGMSQLQVLLVAGGGDGGNGSVGYGGGGGEVKVVDFDGDTSTPLSLVVGDSGQASSVTDGITTGTADPGAAGSSGTPGTPGLSGNGNSGFDTAGEGGGGGAGAAATTPYNGGPGVTAANAPVVGASKALFSTDSNCYGGGGAVGEHGAGIGVATCGGGSVADGTPVTIVAPTPNTGGGGGGSNITFASTAGASGLVVVRWNAPTVTLTFDSNGHGAAVAPEAVVVGTAPTQPANPKAAGFVFNGWYSDAALTTKADFSAPITSATTFFASWDPALPGTGGTLNPLAAPLGAGALGVGLALFAVGVRRTRRAG